MPPRSTGEQIDVFSPQVLSLLVAWPSTHFIRWIDDLQKRGQVQADMWQKRLVCSFKRFLIY